MRKTTIHCDRCKEQLHTDEYPFEMLVPTGKAQPTKTLKGELCEKCAAPLEKYMKGGVVVTARGLRPNEHPTEDIQKEAGGLDSD